MIYLIVADPGVCAILILLELRSTFDTLDHDVIINHLECSVVIKDILAWFQGGFLLTLTLTVFLGSQFLFLFYALFMSYTIIIIFAVLQMIHHCM